MLEWWLKWLLPFQIGVTRLLGIHPAPIPSHLHNGHFSRHTADVELAVIKVLEVITLYFYPSILSHCTTNRHISKFITENRMHLYTPGKKHTIII